MLQLRLKSNGGEARREGDVVASPALEECHGGRLQIELLEERLAPVVFHGPMAFRGDTEPDFPPPS